MELLQKFNGKVEFKMMCIFLYISQVISIQSVPLKGAKVKRILSVKYLQNISQILP